MKQQLNILAAYLEGELKKQLTAQDHIATKKLFDSIDVVVSEIAAGYEIRGEYIVYGKWVDTGTKPGRRVPIDALIDWIKAKKIDLKGKSEESVAYAIQTDIYKRGTPTSGDLNKKRWMSLTIEENEAKIIETIEDIAFGEIDTAINNLVEKTQKLFNNEKAAAA